MRARSSDSGVSPVVGVILMVSITVILTGILFMWTQQLSDADSKPLDIFHFDVALDSDDDEINLMLISGELISSRYFIVNFEGNEIFIPEQNLIAGELIVLTSPIDIQHGNNYNIKIIKDELVIWDGDTIAMD